MSETMTVQSDAFAGTQHQRPRPSRYDKAIRSAAAEALLPEIEQWIGDAIGDAERARIVRVLSDRCGDDGYEIAREFEHEGFQPDAHLVEILDGFDSSATHAKAVREWLAETGAKPRLVIGASVAIPARMKEHENVVGEIVRVDERSGEYTICCTSLGHVRSGLGTHGLIFAWEAVEALNPAQDDGSASRVLAGGSQ